MSDAPVGREQFLRYVLRLSAASCAVVGAAFVIFPGAVNAFLTPRDVRAALHIIGALLALHALHLTIASVRPVLRRWRSCTLRRET